MMQLVHPIPPVVDKDCRILILGSFPSVKSREEGFFYGHPQNRFWRMLAAVFGEEVPMDIPSKKRFLLMHHIALWDVIAACQIEGSSDSSIKNAVPVDIERVLSVASITRVICNGSLAGKLYKRFLLPVTHKEACVLPSTSPANAAWSLDQLADLWKNYLID